LFALLILLSVKTKLLVKKIVKIHKKTKFGTFVGFGEHLKHAQLNYFSIDPKLGPKLGPKIRPKSQF